MKRFMFAAIAAALVFAPGCKHSEDSKAVRALYTASLTVSPRMVDNDMAGQIGPTVIAFRNVTFAEHMGGLTNANGLLTGINAPRFEYFKPTDLEKTEWMATFYGETLTRAGATRFVDLSNPKNLDALARTIVKRCLDQNVKATGFIVDCVMEVPSGQGDYAAVLVRKMQAAADKAGLVMRVNTGDPYWASLADTTLWQGKINAIAKDEWVQVGVNLSDRDHWFNQFIVTLCVANSRIAAGKHISIGVLDIDGANVEKAKQFFASPIFGKPGVTGTYSTTYDPKENVGLQIPGGKPVTEPVQLGILSDLTPLGTAYALSSNWWNLDVSTAPVDARSASIITVVKSYGNNGYLHPDFNATYGMSYAVVDNATPLSPVTFGYASESDNGFGGVVGYPIPAQAKTTRAYYENGEFGNDANRTGDAHVFLLNRDTRVLFELSYCYWDGSTWRAGAGAVFDLNANGRRPTGWTSTDAAGLAVLPGLVRPDEVYGTGPIKHAIRCSFNKIGVGYESKGYVWPASHQGSTDAGAPPLGTRLRLKASKDISGYPVEVRKVLQAMKTYGLIVADRGGRGVYIQGIRSPQFAATVWNPAFHSVTVSDFDIITLGWGKP